MDTLRKRIILDRLLNVFLKRPDNLPPPVMNVLRLGTLQLFFYDSVPDYAAVKTSVDLIKERRLKDLVNAVLRRIAGQKEELGKILEQIGTTYPAWLSDHWREIEGFIPPEDLMEYYQTQRQHAYLFDEERLEGFKHRGMTFAKSSLSEAVYLLNDPGRNLRSARVDEMLLLLKGHFEIPIVKFDGCLSGLENRPWLLHTTSRNSAERSGKKAAEVFLRSAESVREGIYYTDSMTYYETIKAVASQLFEETGEALHFLTEKGFEFVRGKKGIWVIPGVAPKPAYLFSFKRAE